MCINTITALRITGTTMPSGCYLHVLADAVTSIAAIMALLVGKYLGWVWMDPLMGIAGSVLIGFWSIGLLQQTSEFFWTKNINPELAPRIKAAIEKIPTMKWPIFMSGVWGRISLPSSSP